MNNNINEWNEIIDRFIEDENKKIGETFPAYRIFDSRAQLSSPKGIGLYNTFVTEDLIGRFARALGDPNPLYSDPIYAGESLGTVVAPPVFEGCICSTVVKGAFPHVKGISLMDGGTTWEKLRHVVPGDEFSAAVTFDGIRDISRPESPNRILSRESTITLFDKKGDEVSKIRPKGIIRCAVPEENYDPKAPKTKEAPGKTYFSDEELDKLYANLDAQLQHEFIRGANALLYDEIIIGDKLPEIMVGPYDTSDARSFLAAIGLSNAFATKYNAIRNMKGRAVKDPETGALRLPIDWHISDTIARQLGQPKALIFGLHTQALLGYLVGSYIGDKAFVKVLSCRNVQRAYFGDILSFTGKITDKYEENSEKLIKICLEGKRHTGETFIEGEAIVRL